MSRRRKRRAQAGPTGLLLLDKPSGLTSHDVVARVRRLANQPRVGHAGTLDPLATGLLPLLLGEATKLSPFATADDKAYETTALLGARTDTLDAEGTVLQTQSVDPTLDGAMVERALGPLRGKITQQVPLYSAVKVDGHRLHKLARQGKDVTPPSREVTIHQLELLELAPPQLRLAVACSKGTYIRQLVADLGDALGPGAHVTALRRTRVGSLHVREAVTLDALEQAPESLQAHLRSPRQWAQSSLQCLECTTDQTERTRQGQRLDWTALGCADAPPTGHFALVQNDALIAVAEAIPDSDSDADYRLCRVFVAPPQDPAAPGNPGEPQKEAPPV